MVKQLLLAPVKQLFRRKKVLLMFLCDADKREGKDLQKAERGEWIRTKGTHLSCFPGWFILRICFCWSTNGNLCLKIEEEKALKQLRRSMVPHARPLPKFDRPFRPQRWVKTFKLCHPQCMLNLMNCCFFHRSTKQVTRPKSPQLLVDERGARRHAFIRWSPIIPSGSVRSCSCVTVRLYDCTSLLVVLFFPCRRCPGLLRFFLCGEL